MVIRNSEHNEEYNLPNRIFGYDKIKGPDSFKELAYEYLNHISEDFSSDPEQALEEQGLHILAKICSRIPEEDLNKHTPRDSARLLPFDPLELLQKKRREYEAYRTRQYYFRNN